MTPHDSVRETWAALARSVSEAKASDALAPVTVIAPTLHSARDVESFLAQHSPEGSGFVNVRVTTLVAWAKRVSQTFTAFLERSEAKALHREGAVRTVLSKNPGVFIDLLDSPHTIAALARSVQTLEGVSIPPRALEISTLSAEVHRIHHEVAEILRPTFYSQTEVMEAANRWLTEADPDLGTMILFQLEEPLYPLEAALYKSLREHRHTTAIERVPANHDTVTHAVRIVTAPDPEEEARTVARLVVGALDDGIPGHRILVALTAEDPYRVLLHRALDDAGVQVAGLAPRQLSDQAISHHLLQLLELRVRNPIDPVTVLDALASGALEASGRDLPPGPVIERIYRKLRFSTDEDYDPIDPDDRDAGALRVRDKFLTYIAEIEAGIAAIHRCQTWAEVSLELATFLTEFFEPAGPKAQYKDRFGTTLGEKFQQLLDLLPELGSLDAVAPLPNPASVVAKLEHLIRASRENRERIGHGVSVATIEECQGRDIDIAIVCGVAEGFAPPRFAPDPLVAEEFIEALDAGLPSPIAQAQRRKEHFFHLLESAQSGAIVTLPRGDLRGAGERVPSRWLAARITTEGQIEGAEHVPSQRRGYSHGAPGFDRRASNRRERRIREAIATETVSFADSDRPLMAEDFDQSLQLIADRQAKRFTRFNGNLSAMSKEGLLPDRRFSPTSLERYATWPLSFFLTDVLDARPLDALVLSSEMDSLHRGNLIHKVLENFLIRAIDEGATPPLDYLHELLREESSKLKHSYGTFWVQVFFDRALEDIAGELDGWFDEHSRRVDRGWTARETEKGFGDPANKAGIVDPAIRAGIVDPEVSIDLGNGRQIRFKGQVDRIDLSSAGQLQVIDYKTGSKSALEKLKSNPPSLGRTKFQLGVYGLFARNLEMAQSSDKTALASYWFTKHSGDVDSEGDSACYVTISLDETFVQEFEEDVRVVVSLIQEGLFPPKAPEFGFDRYTDLQGQQTVSDLWSGIQDSPSLARFREVFGLDEEGPQ